jgi:molecular chaperone DnaK
MVPVLPRNTTLPTKKAVEIATTHDGQRELELHVFQGDSSRVTECEYLGAVRIDGLPAQPRGAVRVSFQFEAGAEGLLTVTARDLASGRSTAVRLATRDTPAALREKLQLEGPQTTPRGARPLDLVATARPSERKGLFGRLFGAKK